LKKVSPLIPKLQTPHLLHVLPTFVPAGLEMRTVNLIAGFGDEFRHSILAMDGRTDAADRLPPGAPARILPSLPKAGSLATARRLRELLRRAAPDLVLTYNWGAFDMLLAARSLRFRRVVHHEDGFNADEARTFKRRRILARRAVLSGVHRLIVPSDRLYGIATRLWKVPAGQIALIPNGIRLDTYGPAAGDPALRRELGIPEGAPVIGAVGHLRAEKRFDRLLEACAALPGAHVLLVGEGETRPQLEERASRADLAGRVHLAGYRPDPHRFYRAMDVFAVTSDTEQMPVSLLEAMATELPVVSTDVGDVRAMLPSEQAAHLVPLAGEETAAALARHLSALLRDPGGRQRLGRLNRRRVEERFTFETMRDAYRETYHAALCAGSEPSLPEASDALC
jgi:glycosyltransferase involved in cell wall biosynthesis